MRPPALPLKNHLSRPTQYWFVRLPPFLRRALTGRKTGEKWQGPRAGGPGHGSQQQETHPAQAAGFHKMRVRTANRIAVDSPSLNLFTASALDGIVNAQHNRTGGNESFYQEPQQKAAGFPATPASTAQHAMIVDEVAITAAAHNPQATGDGALAWSENGPDQKHLRLPPDTIRKQRGKGTKK